MPQKIYRSKSQRMLAGVCGGFAEYFNIDVTLVRILWVITVLLYGVGVPAYIICCFVIPDNPMQTGKTVVGTDGEEMSTAEVTDEADGHSRHKIAGIILIILGLFLFFRQLFPPLPWDQLWPLVLVGVGVALIWRSWGRGR